MENKDTFIPLKVTLSNPREDYITQRTKNILQHAKSPEDATRQLDELNREVKKLDRENTLMGRVRNFLHLP